jgi:glycerate kinase
VGELVLAAVDAGAERIVVGCGGSASTDGGWGAVEAIGSRERLGGAQVMVACDVSTRFPDAARVFGPQKGAGTSEVLELSERLAQLAEQYRRDLGVDVASLPGSGAAGGLAGGLAALGATLVPGFDLVSRLVGLPARLGGAQLVVTGEGHLDPPSLAGKVVGGVLQLTAGRVPVLCVVGDADLDTLTDPALRDNRVEVVRLVVLAGPVCARRDTAALVEEVVAGRLSGR